MNAVVSTEQAVWRQKWQGRLVEPNVNACKWIVWLSQDVKMEGDVMVPVSDWHLCGTTQFPTMRTLPLMVWLFTVLFPTVTQGTLTLHVCLFGCFDSWPLVTPWQLALGPFQCLLQAGEPLGHGTLLCLPKGKRNRILSIGPRLFDKSGRRMMRKARNTFVTRNADSNSINLKDTECCPLKRGDQWSPENFKKGHSHGVTHASTILECPKQWKLTSVEDCEAGCGMHHLNLFLTSKNEKVWKKHGKLSPKNAETESVP